MGDGLLLTYDRTCGVSIKSQQAGHYALHHRELVDTLLGAFWGNFLGEHFG